MSFRCLSLAFVVAAIPARAQGRPLDEGTLVLTRAGVSVGTESFRVVSAGVGDRTDLIRLTGHVITGEHQISTTLTADSTGMPLNYRLVIKAGATLVFDLKANAAPRRFTSVATDQR